jgi:hypothetical protein
MAEYAFFVRVCELQDDFSSCTSEHCGQVIAEKLAGVAQTLNRGLESFERGNWDAVSHTITQTGKSLVVTFLIRRRST